MPSFTTPTTGGHIDRRRALELTLLAGLSAGIPTVAEAMQQSAPATPPAPPVSANAMPIVDVFPIVPLFPPMIAASDIDVGRWEAPLTDILALRPTTILPGHGNIGGAEIATDVRGYLREVGALVRGSRSPTGLADRIRALHPTWEHSEFIGPALRYFAQRRT